MESTWPTVSLGDPTWIVVAFLAGLAARQLRLPPLAGFLVAGFLLHALGARPGALLEGVADVGVTLLLFTVGLKVDLRLAGRPQVWGVGLAQFVLSGALLTGVISVFAWARIGPFASLGIGEAALLGAALSFSSTVFAVKVLADRGADGSQHGRLAIGILVLQDIAAVAMLLAVSRETPQPTALLLLLLIPLAWPLGRLLDRAGHGELLVLFGIAVALGTSALFEATDVKGALGALLIGVLLGRHPKAEELSKSLLGVKDLFLLGFFLLIGMTSPPTPGGWLAVAVLILLLPLRTWGYYLLFARARLRSRTSWAAALDLTSYSEFGLIVLASAAAAGAVDSDLLAVLALAIALSFAFGAPLAERGDQAYARLRPRLKRWERADRLPGDEDLHVHDVDVIVFGLGRIGSRAYAAVDADIPGRVLGVDMNSDVVARSLNAGRTAVSGDATDPEFWSRAEGLLERTQWVLLTMSSHEANVSAVESLRSRGYRGRIAATSTYPDDAQQLRALGADVAFDVYAEAGTGFASDLRTRMLNGGEPDEAHLGHS